MSTDITFTRIEGTVVILYDKAGLYTQHEAWLRRNEIYAKVGSRFVGLRRNGTSAGNYTLIDYDLGSEHIYGITALGKMVTQNHKDFKEEISGQKDVSLKPKPKKKE